MAVGRIVLVEASAGDRTAAILREIDGALLLTTDLGGGAETALDGFAPVRVQTGGATVVGGRMPPRAAWVEVVDDRGATHQTTVSAGVWLTVIAGAGVGDDGVRFTTASGQPVTASGDAAG